MHVSYFQHLTSLNIHWTILTNYNGLRYVCLVLLINEMLFVKGQQTVWYKYSSLSSHMVAILIQETVVLVVWLFYHQTKVLVCLIDRWDDTEYCTENVSIDTVLRMYLHSAYIMNVYENVAISQKISPFYFFYIFIWISKVYKYLVLLKTHAHFRFSIFYIIKHNFNNL